MAEDLTGHQLGPYEIVELLEYNGITEVYQGRHPQQERDVLIWIVGRHLDVDPVFNARFRREAKAIAGLRHPNIGPVYDYGAAEGGHYMVVGHIEGVTLADILDEVRAGQRTLEVDDITFVARQIGAALDHAHAQGVVHRELMPANIVFTRAGQAIVTGFGFALLHSRDPDSASGSVTAYMAPELSTDLRAATPASDIYALGAIIYEIVTGQLPFELDSEIDNALRHLNDSAPDPRYLKPDIPPAVAETLLKALAKSARDRFANAMQMATALEWAYAHPDAESLPQARPLAPLPEEAEALQPAKPGTSSEQIIVKRGPTPTEARREKRRLRAEHRRLQREEEAKEREARRREQAKIKQAKREKRRVRQRKFMESWGRALLILFVGLLLLSAAGYFLQSVGILSVSVVLPTLPPRPTQVIAESSTPAESLTPTIVPTATIIPTPTPLQPLPATAMAPLEFAPLDVGTSAYRIHDGGVMQFVPAGSFLMGTNDARRSDNAKPQHPVMLTDYWIDRTEVTNAQYRMCVDEGLCQPPIDRGLYDNPEYATYPVVFVRYDSAVAYCLWLAGQANQVAGLPTEAQWEKAAAWDPIAGVARPYPWGSEAPSGERMRYLGSNAVRPAAPVGSYPAGASAYGVLDMAGNVWEWVADWYDENYYKRTGVILDPMGPPSGDVRITRGGSWTREANLALSSSRNPTRPDTASNEIGFRCAMSTERPPIASGVLLTPIDVVQALKGLLEKTKVDQADSGAGQGEVIQTIEAWISSLEELRVALQSGNKRTALLLMKQQVLLLDEQRNSGLFTSRLSTQIEHGLLWIQEQIGPETQVTPTATP